MKPSEQIIEIATKMYREDWVKWGGNKYSKEEWEQAHRIDDNKLDYFHKALLEYLDSEEEIKDIRRENGTL